MFGFDEHDHNCLVSYFTNGRYRAMHMHWASAANGVVARFRADAARYPDDPEFGRIAEDLKTVSPEFAELWSRHEVGGDRHVTKAVRHPGAGELIFESSQFTMPDRPGQSFILVNPMPDTGTDQALRRLMAEAADASLVVAHP